MRMSASWALVHAMCMWNLFLKVICDNSGCIYSDSSIGNSSKSSSGSNCGIAAFRGVVAKGCVRIQRVVGEWDEKGVW